MSSKIKLVSQKLKKSIDRKGILNINHIQVESRKKLTEIGYLFKNPKYQTFRILYMNNNSIIGEEILNIQTLYNKKRSLLNNNGIMRAEKCIYKIKNRMELLKANQYLLIHTIPLEGLSVSRQQLDTTTYFYTYLNGFMGHLIMNAKSYIWIDIYKNNVYIEKKDIKKNNNSIHKKLYKHNLSQIQLKGKKDIVQLVSKLLVKENHSIIAITEYGQIPNILLDIPNQYINKDNQYIKNYLNNLRKLYKSSKIILITENGNTFKDSLNLLLDNTFDDSIWYTELKSNLYMYNLPNLKEYQKYNNVRSDLFEKRRIY